MAVNTPSSRQNAGSSNGPTVRLLRVAMGLSRAALAALAGTTEQTITDAESGFAALDVASARRVAEALGVPSELMVPALRLVPSSS
jgi:transcriptional regulator with XRE-family HTH domain